MKCLALLFALFFTSALASKSLGQAVATGDPPVTLALPPVVQDVAVVDVPPPAVTESRETLEGSTVLTGDLYVPRCGYTASTHGSGPTHCGGDDCCAECGKPCGSSDSRLERCKACKQQLYWGYCNFFDERPFGATVANAMTRQIQRGSSDLLMLYEYDFYPRESSMAGQLTPRGRWQLQKIVGRMQVMPGQIVIQVTDSDLELTAWRKQHVVEALDQLGMPSSDQLIAFGRQRYGMGSVEAMVVAENLMQTTRSRGRTVSRGETAGFGRALSGGFSN